jgi:hypothetical protein
MGKMDFFEDNVVGYTPSADKDSISMLMPLSWIF